MIRRGQRRDRPRPVGELPRVGAVVEAGPADRDRTWATRVEAVTGSRLVVVAPTVAPGRVVPLAVGGSVVVTWPTELGLMRADGLLVDVEHDVVTSWVLEVERTDRAQRRSAFRLPVALAAVLRPAGGPSVPTTARTEDVSELGVSCTVPVTDAPQVGAAVEVTIAVPDDEPIVADAFVVRADLLPLVEDGPREVRLGLRLVDDDEERRERLRRFVLDEQLRRRRQR